MKNKIILALLLILVLGSGGRTQTASAVTTQGGGPHTTCLTPVAGSYFFCVATDGVWVSNNGATYFQVVAPVATAGVTAINICGAAGTGCVPATITAGAVNLNIPKATQTLQ